MGKRKYKDGIEIDEYPGYLIGRDGTITNMADGTALKYYYTPDGYVYVSIKDRHNAQKRQYVHRLVGMAWLVNPEGLPEINHKDENKKNNNAENLEWCTRLYNNRYGTRCQRLSAGRMGGNNPRAKMVVVDNIWYGSHADARRALNLTEYALMKYIKTHPDTCWAMP